jgi:hypothetical protein
MANLFNLGVRGPDYVTASGQAMPRKAEGTFFGIFPGTPDYVIVTSAPAPVPPSPANGSPTPSAPVPATCPPSSATAPHIEVRIDVPGFLHLHGALALPQVQELALLALPLLAHAIEKMGEPPEDPEPCATAREPEARPAEPEARTSGPVDSEIQRRALERD